MDGVDTQVGKGRPEPRPTRIRRLDQRPLCGCDRQAEHGDQDKGHTQDPEHPWVRDGEAPETVVHELVDPENQCGDADHDKQHALDDRDRCPQSLNGAWRV